MPPSARERLREDIVSTTVLVTGGAGLIGSHIVDLLLERGYRVKVLDNLEPTTHPNGRPAWVPAAVEFIQGDVRNLDDWRRSLRDVEWVFHQAAYGGFAPEISKMTEVNTSGTARMFEAIRTDGLNISKIVVASSQAVYGEGSYTCPRHGTFHPGLRPLAQLEQGLWEVRCPECGTEASSVPIAEHVCPDVTGVYSITKYSQERMAIALGKEFGIPAVALRYALTYGPRQSLFNPYTGICSIFSMRILNGLPPVIYEDGRQTRDFTFVRDVARANLFVMEKEEANYHVFNVGTGRATSVAAFARLLARLYGRPEIEPSLPGEFRPLDLRHLITDTTKLSALGFVPEYTLEQGLQEYVSWIATQRHPKEYFEEAMRYLKKIGVVRPVRNRQ